MKFKTLTGMALVGAMLAGGGAAMAAKDHSDWTTTLNVKLALLEKLGTDSMSVDVDSNTGALVLTGTVHKRATKELAETIAQSVDGVKSVKNDILLEASLMNTDKVGLAAGEAEAEVKDAMLETRIRIALVDKMHGNGFQVGTEAASGSVTLEFDRDFSVAQRQEATTVVKGVEGVTKVVSVDKK
jgi:osmotically-inducible protein OsmY